jgi:hypothetical protein
MGNPGTSGHTRPGRQGVAVGLVLALALAPAFGWPWLSAWWQFPAPPAETFRAAVLAEATALRFATAFDASGSARTLAAAAIIGIAPGPCSRWYQPDDRDRGGARGPRPFGAGMAEFTCLADLTAQGHGPLRAVVGLRLYTRPAPDMAPRANILPDGPHARDWLARLEGRR